jgi:hypothetical protein
MPDRRAGLPAVERRWRHAVGCVLLGYGFAASLATVGQYLAYGPLLLLGLLRPCSVR